MFWVDIIGKKVHSVQLGKEEETHKEYQLDEYAGVIYLTTNEDIILVGLEKGISELNLVTGEVKSKFTYPANDKLRSNDGNIDPNGNIWQGLMGNFEHGPIKDGKVLRINEKEITEEISPILIPNGINWSKDGEYCFFTSSLEFKIFKFKFNKELSKLESKQVFIDFKELLPEIESPEPDGFAMSEDGDIYTAVWSSSCVFHFNSDGELIEKFHFPAQRISAVAFGGPDLNEMFVTSGNLQLEDVTKLNENPQDLGGSIFRVKLDSSVKGLIRPKYSL